VQAVASRTGANAAALAKRFGAAYATTDVGEVLQDPDVDAVLIATRHDSHAHLTLAALEAGKAVLVEKPLALTSTELDDLAAFFERQGAEAPLLQTGYNRRFSPLTRALRDWLAGVEGPAIINYEMNAGWLPADNWVHGPEGGGRNVGEACHVYDVFRFLIGDAVTSFDVSTISSSSHYRADDNFLATMRYRDGSVANLTYTALGSSAHQKERAIVFAGGEVAELHDYRTLTFAGRRDNVVLRDQDKGHRAELVAFADALRGSGAWPIPLDEQLEVARLALGIDARLPGRGEDS
jgi:predicted dehydrogenase